MGRLVWDQTRVPKYRTEGTRKQALVFWDGSQKESAQEVYVSPNKAIKEKV